MKRAWSRWAALASGAALAIVPAGRAEPAQELGLNIHQSQDVGLDITRDAHLGWVRIDLNWLDAQPTAAAPDFTRFDAIVDGANARGLKVLATIGYTPAWASTGDAANDGSSNDVPVEGAYATFVASVVDHFQGRVFHYELWNEANLDVFFEGTPDEYVELVLLPGAAAVHAGCPSCFVVAPSVASVGDDYDVFLDTVLAAAKDEIDIISGHAYAQFPDMGAGGLKNDDFFDKLESHRVIEAGGTVFFEGPLSFREVMDAHGATQPFFMTETGFEADPADPEALASQVLFTRHVLEAMLSRPWWTTTIFYEGFDEPGSGYAFGIAVHDGSPAGYTPKPAFDLIKKARDAQPRLGGTIGDCADGLDEDADGLIDFPADPDCISKADLEEGILSDGTGVTEEGGGGGASTGGAGGAGDAGETASDGCDCRAGAGRDRPLPWAAALAFVFLSRGLLHDHRRRRGGPGERHRPRARGVGRSAIRSDGGMARPVTAYPRSWVAPPCSSHSGSRPAAPPTRRSPRRASFPSRACPVRR